MLLVLQHVLHKLQVMDRYVRSRRCGGHPVAGVEYGQELVHFLQLEDSVLVVF